MASSFFESYESRESRESSGSIVVSRGRPSVSVPVLSTTRVSADLSVSSSFGVAKEDAGRSPSPHAHHHGHRRGETQGARASDDQYGDRIDERVRETQLRTPNRPAGERRTGRHQHGRHEDRRYLVYRLFNGTRLR